MDKSCEKCGKTCEPANQCVSCGEDVPDGDQICEKCKSVVSEPLKSAARMRAITEMFDAALQVVSEASKARYHAQESYKKAEDVWNSAKDLRNAIVKLAEMELES